jgi:RNA polymerase sigma factor (sigma-70 family)
MKKLEEMSDEELALHYMDGNNRAFDILLSRNQAKLFSYILFIVRDEDTANDIFQDTFFKIIVRLQHRMYQPTGKFSAWSLRIAHNVIMDWYRVRKSEHIIEPTENNDLSKLNSKELFSASYESQQVNAQVLSDVKKLMSLLPRSQREVVYMRFYQQLSFREIAEATEVSINTALGRMRYALINMRRMAKAHGLQLQLED